MENSTALLTSPQSPSNPNPNPNPNHRPTKSTAFKREERRKRKERKRQEKLAKSLCCWDPLSSRPSDRSDSSISVSDTPWPCDPDPAPPNDSSEWTPFVRPYAPQKPTPLSPIVSSKDVQTSALEMCKSFFVVEEEEENGDCTDEEGEGYERVLGFFSDLFRTHVGLTRFYEERREKGVLVCLVCGKKFGSCISLLHHASTVTKARQRRAHRVYAVAMSQILGLNVINQVPVVRISKYLVLFYQYTMFLLEYLKCPSCWSYFEKHIYDQVFHIFAPASN